MGIRVFLMVLAVLSPVFVARILWPRLARPDQPLFYWVAAVGAVIWTVGAVHLSLAFVLACIGLTPTCINDYDCAISAVFDGLRWWYLGSSALLSLLAYAFTSRRGLAFGQYPEVSLKRAREKRDEARRQLDKGIEPAEQQR